jgi:amino acid transporter
MGCHLRWGTASLAPMQPNGGATDGAPVESVGYLEAVSIGVGGMVGGGIFAVLGLAVGVGKGGTFIAFLVAGLVALLTAYSYAHLSVALPSEGGTVEFLNQAFGPRRLAGSLNVLLWFSYVITTSLYAFAFGSYGATFFPESAQALGAHILISAVIIGMTMLNVFSARLITSAEDYIVAAKIVILVIFVVVALTDVDFAAIKPGTWASPGSLMAGGMLIFVAYEGFELIANAAADVKNPAATIPRALYTSVVFTIVLYMLVAIVVVGLLSLTEIALAEDFALAEAAQVVWGGIGFDLIVVAALLSTASAINATLYGTARLTVVIALDGELPTQLERKICGKPIVGLLLTAAAALVIANLVPLAAISSLASAGFLAIFAAVNIANVRLASVTNASPLISITGAVACLSALTVLIAHTATTRPADLVLLGALAFLTYTGEATYVRRRQLRPLNSHFEPRYHPTASSRQDGITE